MFILLVAIIVVFAFDAKPASLPKKGFDAKPASLPKRGFDLQNRWSTHHQTLSQPTNDPLGKVYLQQINRIHQHMMNLEQYQYLTNPSIATYDKLEAIRRFSTKSSFTTEFIPAFLKNENDFIF
jgi:hypothetical protein